MKIVSLMILLINICTIVHLACAAPGLFDNVANAFQPRVGSFQELLNNTTGR